MAVVESIKSTNTDSLVLCYKRRRRRRIMANDPIQIDIEKLPDALLFEVLYRLPCRWALQYKSVSKRWCSLISHPQFVRSYIHHRHQFSKSDTDPFTLVLHYGKQLTTIFSLFHFMMILGTVAVTDSIFSIFFPISNKQEKVIIPFPLKHRSMTYCW